jgi:hypothetical protein
MEVVMNLVNLVLTMVSAFLGALLSLVASIVIENQRQPKLNFKIEEPPLDQQYNQAPAKSVRFLRIQLLNNPLPKAFRWLDRNAAVHCSGYVQFHHYDDGAPKFKDPMPLRWSGSGDPLTPHISPDGKPVNLFDPAKYEGSFWRNCYTGTEETIDIAARFDREAECYGWTTESYLYNWRNTKWKLPKGRYLVTVTVNLAGKKVIGIFKLENSAGRKDFRLLEASPEDKKKTRKWSK